MENMFNWLQNWYKSHCDGDWEHDYRIKIKTLDSPGWHITINIMDTECEGHPFLNVNNKIDEMNWFFCLIKNNYFEAKCGPRNISNVLQIFREWVESCQQNSYE